MFNRPYHQTKRENLFYNKFYPYLNMYLNLPWIRHEVQNTLSSIVQTWRAKQIKAFINEQSWNHMCKNDITIFLVKHQQLRRFFCIKQHFLHLILLPLSIYSEWPGNTWPSHKLALFCIHGIYCMMI